MRERRREKEKKRGKESSRLEMHDPVADSLVKEGRNQSRIPARPLRPLTIIAHDARLPCEITGETEGGNRNTRKRVPPSDDILIARARSDPGVKGKIEWREPDLGNR